MAKQYVNVRPTAKSVLPCPDISIPERLLPTPPPLSAPSSQLWDIGVDESPSIDRWLFVSDEQQCAMSDQSTHSHLCCTQVRSIQSQETRQFSHP